MSLRVCRVATVPFFLQHHLREQICAIVRAGHQVELVSAGGVEVSELLKIPGIKFHQIDIPRAISPWRDLRALWMLFLLFRNRRFDIVHSTTPKAGMLCAIAGCMAGIPIRLHTFTGQPWVELVGLKRYLAKAGDWLTAHLTTLSYADSHSQRDFLITQGIASHDNLTVLGKGSLAGVDLERFGRKLAAESLAQTRHDLGIPDGAVVITFIGRLTRDKGVAELVDAFAELTHAGRSCVLMLVGPQEPERDPLPSQTISSIDLNPWVFLCGYTSSPERYLSVTDIFCLPSYREGFGNVVIEAAAMGVPTVGTDIVGLRDSVEDGVTGSLVPPKDASALASALQRLIDDSELRLKMGNAARARAFKEFDSHVINAELLREYDRLAGNCI